MYVMVTKKGKVKACSSPSIIDSGFGGLYVAKDGTVCGTAPGITNRTWAKLRKNGDGDWEVIDWNVNPTNQFAPASPDSPEPWLALWHSIPEIDSGLPGP